MKQLLTFITLFPFVINAQVFWTENFGTANCSGQGTLAHNLNTANGIWTVTATGTNDAAANQWYVSSTEAGMGVGNCGDGCLSNSALNNRTLHIGNVSTSPAAFLFCPAGDCGAAYDAGIGFNNVRTSKRAESPTINCTGRNNITVNFAYLEEGQSSTDNFTFWYYDGVVWAQLSDPAKTNNSGCSGQGRWTTYTVTLPASANNNVNVKIGFHWVNNDDAVGSDPSVAIDDITLSASPGAAPVTNFTVSSTVICVGSCVTFTDQSTNAPVSWLWSFQGASTSSSTIQSPTNICYNTPGTYSVSLIAANGTGADTLERITYITVHPLPTISANSNTTICKGNTANLTVSGASTYTWTPSAGISTTTGNSINASPSVTTNYSVTGTDANGCSNTTTINLTVNSPSITATGVTSICEGDSSILSLSGANLYLWMPSQGLSSTTGSPVTVNPTANTTYTVVGEDIAGCYDTLFINVSVNQNPIAFAGPDDTVCSGESAFLSASGGGVYLWSNGISTASINVSPLNNTIYTVTVSNGNCFDVDEVQIFVNPSPVANAGTNITILQGASTTLSGTGGGTYLWQPSNGLSCVTCQNPVAAPIETTAYILIVTDANGCTSSDTIIVIVDIDCDELYVPTAFSPNGDGQNDVYFLLGNCITQLTFSIYNRWGEKVFETNDIMQGWDGKYNEKPVDSGVFTYHIYATLVTGGEVQRSGNITLLR